MDLSVSGADELYRLRQQLKTADKVLWKALTKEFRVAGKVPAKAAKNRARASLPQGGGLNRRIESTRISVVTRTGLNTAGISIRARGRAARLADEKGIVPHPLFKNRGHWYATPVQAGWFTEPMKASAPYMQGRCVNAMDEVGRRISRG